MDEVGDKWWLYALGQELGRCKAVQDQFKLFVRRYVLGIPEEAATSNGAHAPAARAEAAV